MPEGVVSTILAAWLLGRGVIYEVDHGATVAGDLVSGAF